MEISAQMQQLSQTKAQRGARRAAEGPKGRFSRSWVLGSFLLGAIAGAAFTTIERNEVIAGAIIISVLVIVILVLNNIAERSDIRLLAGDASYRAFFENAVEGIFRTTPDGHYLEINDALARIYGYPSRSEMKNTLTDIASQLYVDPKRRDEFKKTMEEHDQVTGFVSEIRRYDGSTIWISENARAVRDCSGRLLCYEGTTENVTERTEAERLMREGLHKAKEANRAKNAFMAAMSHELKTPLNAVIGFSEILKDEIFGPIGNRTYHTYACDIHASGQKLLRIINDVLDVSKLVGAAVTINPKPCPVRDLVESAIDAAFGATGNEREVQIRMDRDLPPVHADPDRLRQALVNLLSNALKFTPEDAAVSVDARLDASGGIRIQVTDTGIGMEPEMIAIAFEPFRQLDNSLARRFEGAGLGLPIAKALVELHGGELVINSAVGEGTTATIVLPPSRTGSREISSVA